jgi:predicted dehydrogenase
VLGAPTAVSAVGSVAASGVDERADLLLTSADATALVSTSLVTALPVTASVYGSEGRLDVLSPSFGPSGVTVTMRARSTGAVSAEESVTWRDRTFAEVHEGLGYQATCFSSYVSEGRVESPLHPHAELVSVMATIDEARRQIREASAAR